MPFSATRRFLFLRQVLTGTLLAIPILVWLWALNRYAVDVVHHDDFTLLGFLARWTNPARNWSEQLSDLVAQHNTHRIIYDRLVVLGTYYLTGRLSVTVMIGLGNLSVLGICWQLWRGFRQLGRPAWQFLPIPFWLFSLQSHENMFWGMAALQNFTVVWFILEALHQLHRRASLIWPILLGVAACLTSGNGILAFLVGTLLLVSQQRRWPTLAVWLSTTAIVLWLMLGVAPIHHDRTPLLDWVPNACILLGAAFTNQLTTTPPMLLALLLGGLLLAGLFGVALVGWLFPRTAFGKRLRNLPITPEWLAFGVFVLATALLLAMHRVPDELLRERYKLYAHLLLSVVYLLGLAVLPRVGWQRTWVAGATAAAVMMNIIAAHSCLPRIVLDYQERQADAFNFAQNGTTLALPAFRVSTDSLMRTVHERGIYRYTAVTTPAATWPAQPLADSLSVRVFQDDSAGNVFVGMHPVIAQFVSQTMPRRLTDASEQGTFFVLESATQRRYLFPTSIGKSGFRQFITTGTLFRPGFTASFHASRVPPGRYRIKVLRITTTGPTLLDPNQTVLIPAA